VCGFKFESLPGNKGDGKYGRILYPRAADEPGSEQSLAEISVLFARRSCHLILLYANGLQNCIHQ